MINVQILSYATSDHRPICLKIEDMESQGPIPFNFNLLWLNLNESYQIIETSLNINIKGSPSYIWESKLRAMKIELKKWYKSQYSSLIKN